ncbi:MAG: amidophosphoribosyltransferase [Kiritimatiellia bacterium]
MDTVSRDSDSPKEFCGICGVYGISDVGPTLYQGLFSLQHRGQEGAGIATADGREVYSVRGQGLVNEVFGRQDWSDLPGHLGIGHVRYSTTGSTRIQNVQPLVAECVDGIWAVAHNGNLVNAQRMRRMYQEAGAIFQTSTDSEVLVHLLADPMYRTRPRRVARALAELEGAFCFLLMTRNCLLAARDRYGFRPLSIGRLGDGYVVASETCALEQVGATYLRDVEPGELVIIDESGMHSTFFAEGVERQPASCIFEVVYFARPDSMVFGKNVHEVRVQYGRQLAKEHPVDADVVVAVPDSGNSAALGYSIESKIPLEHGFIRNHYVGRTFIMPQQQDRSRSVDMKLAVLREAVDGKRVIVVDDSVVRGTTARRRVQRLRDAGASEVHMRVSCPPIKHPCFYGIDFPTSDELIAGSMDVDEICAYLGADSLGYLSLDGLFAPFNHDRGFCAACFTGNYPTDISGVTSNKHALENRSELNLNI